MVILIPDPGEAPLQRDRRVSVESRETGGRQSTSLLNARTRASFVHAGAIFLSGLFGESKQDEKPEAAFQKLLQFPDKF